MVESEGFINFLQALNFRKVGSWELIHGELHHSIKVEIIILPILFIRFILFTRSILLIKIFNIIHVV